MKKSRYIWLAVIAGVVLLSGMLISNSVVEKSADKTVAVTKVNYGCCAGQSEAVSNASYASASKASGSDCPYMSSCGSEASASSCDSKTNAAYTSGSSSKCAYKSKSVQMAAEKSAEKDQPALTSVK